MSADERLAFLVTDQCKKAVAYHKLSWTDSVKASQKLMDG